MASEYEKSLIADALRVAQLVKLPAKTSVDDYTWVEAIAKIIKRDGSCGYGIVKRTNDLSITYVYTNGNISAIAFVEEVYPYEMLDKRRVKKFDKKDDKESRIAYLQSLNLPYEIDFENASVADLNKEVVKAALFQQINSKEE